MLERQKTVVDVAARTASCLQDFEVVLEARAAQRLGDFRVRKAAALGLFDLLGHAVERLEGRRVRQAGHGLVDPPLRLRALLLGDQQVPLPLGLLDLVVQLPERALELFGLARLATPGLLERETPLGVLLVAHEGLLRQIVSALLHGEHGPVLPLPRLLHLIVELGPQLPLVGDRRGDLSLGLSELVPHVEDDLVQHFLRVLSLGDQIIDIRLDEGREL